MLDPTSDLFRSWQQLMGRGEFVGANRPVGRVTFRKGNAEHGPNKINKNHSNKPGPWRSWLLDQDPLDGLEMEVLTIGTNRAISQDAGTCTITMANLRPRVADGRTDATRPDGDDSQPGSPGYLTPYRGEDGADIRSKYREPRYYGNPVIAPPYAAASVWEEGGGSSGGRRGRVTDWGYERNRFFNLLIPNTMIRTYQGYGSDNYDDELSLRDANDVAYVHPAADTQLVQTGVWLIDKVVFTADGMITIECRDMAKLLIEQYIFPPMIPMSRFPLTYCPAVPDKKTKRSVTKNKGKYDTCSPAAHARYGPNSLIFGHKATDAFDGKPGTYWLGHSYENPTGDYNKDWIQADCNGDKINTIDVTTVGGQYVIFVSIFEEGEWKGSNVIPYSTSGEDHGHKTGINYVKRVSMGNDESIRIKLDRTYKAKKVRLTFTNLRYFPIDLVNYFPYRVGVRKFEIFHIQKSSYKEGTEGKPGYIEDWSEPIKELCGWAGFTWPDATPNNKDPLLGVNQTPPNRNKPMRVWGDFEKLGTGPIVCTPPDYFMNKSFMEGIRQVVDMLGCIFFVDESGGAIFRLANMWDGGNFITDPNAPQGLSAHIGHYPIEFHEEVNLTEYSLTLDDKNVRSEILVVGADPNVHSSNQIAGGYVLHGHENVVDFSRVLGGMNRLMMVPGDKTSGFKTDAECQRMAELIALQILFNYRSGNLSAPCHPGLQIDDQVRIFERVTYERNIHYVSGIATTMDLRTGEYTMDVTTHWLGTDPKTDWFLDKKKLTPAVRNLPAVQKRLAKSK